MRADGRRRAACAVSKLQKNTRETENRTATVLCARRRIVLCVSGAASKNRERGSFVFFRPCEHWKREGGPSLGRMTKQLREGEKNIAGHFAVSGYSNNQSSDPKRVATNRF